ncbi:DUF2961 domain-containing protein [Alienimonas sp. DA493]|uniref:DUF2961 domain-containing protein n=1 Tax=Alienimonas sp. DA493 TaxID=3373605 RepID=UPI00375488C6
MRSQHSAGASAVLAVLTAGAAAFGQAPPTIPVGYDAYLQWDQWPLQRVGARAHMRSTYDRRGNNETADASHYLYQEREDFNVTLDVEGPGMLYFARYNHWHGSPWHYEVDGRDRLIRETTTADPGTKLADAVFLPERAFPRPLAVTYATTKGADLSWVPIGFEERFRMAYSRTFYGTGYYIYHQYLPGAELSRPIESWSPEQAPPEAVVELFERAGTDLAPQPGTPEGDRLGVEESRGETALTDGTLQFLTLKEPATVRALKFSVPREQAVDFGHVRLRITWDDREQPSVDAPVALFFGTGTLHNPDEKEHLVKALPVNVRFADDRAHLACYFPMPYFTGARFELINDTGVVFENVRWSVRTQPLRGDSSGLAYFHATYRDHPNPRPGHDNVFLDTDEAEGGGPWSGSFVGTSFIFSDRGVLTTLEGDPRFFFDDSRTPQAQGTGTEEWGGGGDYWGGRTMTLPLAGHPVGAPNSERKRNRELPAAEENVESAYRFLLGDLMPFGRRAVIRFEHGGENQSEEHYQSVAYWYGAPRATLELTDTLDVGDPASEREHAYRSPDAGAPYELTSRYEWGPDSIHITNDEQDGPVAAPEHFADFTFEAQADTDYAVWIRGRSSGGLRTDAVWFQFDDAIGTTGRGGFGEKGFGNWRDAAPPGAWSWSSELPDQPPRTVRFERAGRHRLRLQRRDGEHEIDQIWLSPTQRDRPAPDFRAAADGSGAEIVLEASDALKKAGGVQAAKRAGRIVLTVGPERTGTSTEVFPATTKIGRTTATFSEFELTLRPDNVGVMLRRTLDYGFPNQRARVFVAEAGEVPPRWREAGVWYLAGSNTYYHSWPKQAGELGASQPVVQTSNRRFRDDEFLLPRDLTAGRNAIRVRVEFLPVKRPLLPGGEVPDLAWSEIAYRAYCFLSPGRPGE